MKNILVKLTCFILSAILMTSFITLQTKDVSAANSPTKRYDFSSDNLKVVSTIIEEENPFTVQATYSYWAVSYGYWEPQPPIEKDCPECNCAGTIVCRPCRGVGDLRCSTCNGTGEISSSDRPVTCNYPGNPVCRAACDGWDYVCARGHVYSNSYGEYVYCSYDGCNASITRSHVCDCICYDVSTPKECSSCYGRGRKSCYTCAGTGQETCPTCKGHGTIWVPQPDKWIPPTNPGNGTAVIDFLVSNKVVSTENITITAQNQSVDSSPDGAGWEVWGSITVTAELDAGEGIGRKDVETRINWQGKSGEINSGNNNKTAVIDVKPATNITVTPVTPNAFYREDTEVVTTFIIHNNNDTLGLNIRPKHKLVSNFEVINPVTNAVIHSQSKEGTVIPKNGTNPIYFKWEVPKDYEGDILLKCTVNKNKAVNETNYTDNTATMTHEVKKVVVSQTPDTVFENTPSGFTPPNRTDTVQYQVYANEIKPSATYEEWLWENDWYKKASYTLELTSELTVKPDTKNPTAKEKDVLWEVKSGYGLSVSSKQGLKNSGLMTAPATAFTLPQRGSAHLPEYRYLSALNKYRTLEQTEPGQLELIKNEYAMDEKGESEYRRVHFVPLWYPDGDYVVKTYTYDCWTPAGMLSVVSDGKVHIKGNMYDDWYITHSKQKPQ